MRRKTYTRADVIEKTAQITRLMERGSAKDVNDVYKAAGVKYHSGLGVAIRKVFRKAERIFEKDILRKELGAQSIRQN